MGYSITKIALTEERILFCTARYEQLVNEIVFLSGIIIVAPHSCSRLRDLVFHVSECLVNNDILAPPYTIDMCEKDLATKEALDNIRKLAVFLEEHRR